METLANPILTAFEIALLDALLAGDHPYLSSLRVQRLRATPVLREWSSAGEFLTFKVPGAPLVSPVNFEISDVNFNMDGVDHTFGGAVLFIEKGAIKTLETFSYVDDFPVPGAERGFTIFYDDEQHRLERLQAELEWRSRGMPPDSIPKHLR